MLCMGSVSGLVCGSCFLSFSPAFALPLHCLDGQGGKVAAPSVGSPGVRSWSSDACDLNSGSLRAILPDGWLCGPCQAWLSCQMVGYVGSLPGLAILPDGWLCGPCQAWLSCQMAGYVDHARPGYPARWLAMWGHCQA